MGKPVDFIWHHETNLDGFDAIILPGGFAYGDYLRTGAIARFSPVMGALTAFAGRGGMVIGICNGFQILMEAGLLPGALLPNIGLKYVCRFLHLKTESSATPFTSCIPRGQVLYIPIGHGEGNFYADDDVVRKLEDGDRVVFRYVDAAGRATDQSNPNGSVNNIAGIVNERRNVLGMMPHPDRSSEQILGSDDGRLIFESMVTSLSHA